MLVNITRVAKKPGNLEFDNLGKTKTWNFLEKSWKNQELFLNLNFLTTFI